MNRWWLAVFVFLELILPPGYAAPPQEPALWIGPRTYEPSGMLDPRRGAPIPRLRDDQSPARGKRIRLTPLSAAEAAVQLRQPPEGPLKIGFSRSPEGLLGPLEIRRALDFRPLPEGGFVGHLTVESPGAKALRLGLRFLSVPQGLEIRVHDATLSQIHSVPSTEIDQGAPPGPHPDPFREYWTPPVSGASLGLEVILPPGLLPEDFAVEAIRLNHLVLDPLSGSSDNNLTKASASCNLDSRCYPEWSSASQATARIIFVSGGGSYVCTGTLLNDAEATDTPYFLTAHHCVSTPAEAASIVSYWFYYSASCNSKIPNPGTQTMRGGGTLLYSSEKTDASFLRLNGPLPEGVRFSGWTNLIPDLGRPVTGFHNPNGDLQKIIFGATRAYLDCWPTTEGQFWCDPSEALKARFIDITQVDGTTEGGSSGSGIFLDQDQFLFGQLYGGDASCAYPQGSTVYGLFGQTYQEGALAQWLGPSRESQTITLSLPKTLAVFDTVPIEATASSGLKVSLTTSTPALCRLKESLLEGLSPGLCRILGTQMGDARYRAASAEAVVTVIKANQTITLSLPEALIWGREAPFSARASSGLSVTTLVKTPETCRLEGERILGLAPGLCRLQSDQPGNDLYQPAVAEGSLPVVIPDYPGPSRRLQLTVEGPGRVFSDPVGLACPSYCALDFSRGTRVTLTALAPEGSQFVRWQGACQGSSPRCTLRMGKSRRVRALFR